MKKKDPTSHRIIEKRRRDRMNNCLADLSKLIPSHYLRKGRGRVEKTEIIEMAIRHLRDLRESSLGFQATMAATAGQQQQQQLLGLANAGSNQVDFSYANETPIELSKNSNHHQQPIVNGVLPLDCTSQSLQRAIPMAKVIGTTNTHMIDSNGVHHDKLPYYDESQGPQQQQHKTNHHNHHSGPHHKDLALAVTPASPASSSASLSMKAFQHQQYHNNERQINNRASEQANNKYRNECCNCRCRMATRSNESNGNNNNNNNNNTNNTNNNSGNDSSSSDGNNNNNNSNSNDQNNQNNCGSSSDQSDTGSTDYPTSSSSGSNKTQAINNKSNNTSESSSGEGSPTSSLSPASSSSSSSGWYKKAWLIRSFSRSVSKN
uniref:BHLH domain-containing protein n=1 Tax=Aceria tosichella TaxID=561515 RepID=A0A6G1SI17_9ACAR